MSLFSYKKQYCCLQRQLKEDRTFEHKAHQFQSMSTRCTCVSYMYFNGTLTTAVLRFWLLFGVVKRLGVRVEEAFKISEKHSEGETDGLDVFCVCVCVF